MTNEETPSTLARAGGASIAYHRTRADESRSRGTKVTLPGIVFLGGFMSDMTGGKALALETHAKARGQAFLRFDYLGHGASSGRFEDGTIGGWAEDAITVLDELSDGPQILVGSSMGGWIMLLSALARPERVAGLIGIAAAPDFTQTLMWDAYGPDIRATLQRDGIYYQGYEGYENEGPYPITLRLIEEARAHLLMDRPIPIKCPVHLLHGTKDADVPYTLSLELMDKLESTQVDVTLVKDGDHRLSEPLDLARLTRAVAALSGQVA